MKRYEWIMSIIITICTLGVMLSPISPFAIAEKVETTAARLDQKIINDNITAWQRQIFELELFYAKNPPMPDEVKRQIMELKMMIERARQQQGKG